VLHVRPSDKDDSEGVIVKEEQLILWNPEAKPRKKERTTMNEKLNAAKSASADEFYTDWTVIEQEVMEYYAFNPDVFRGKTILLPCDDPEWSNFTKFFALLFTQFGIKQIISTSYAKDGGRGKVFRLDADSTGDGVTDIDDLRWEYLDGDGDFRSTEVRALRDEADVVITNPPFSLFREFLAWIVAADKEFLILGNMNAITYKESFPLIRDGKMWLGPSIHSGDREFRIPEHYRTDSPSLREDEDGNRYVRVPAVRWFTNLDHGKRHEPLQLMTAADNLRFSPKMEGLSEYQRYDNYAAIEVPAVKCIPSDHDGVMGVPISFLDKHNPEQFQIIGIVERDPDSPVAPHRIDGHEKYDRTYLNGMRMYSRLFIRRVA
jgi:hypothetical protein